MTRDELMAAAVAMLDRSYCPYSHFPVGAALECADGTVFTGCNIEIASFGATVCGERTAAFKAVSEGEREFRAVAVVTPQLLPHRVGPENLAPPGTGNRANRPGRIPVRAVLCLHGAYRARNSRASQ
jgi:cytidine deaminase